MDINLAKQLNVLLSQMGVPTTKIVMNLVPFEKGKAIHMIDRSVQELASQSTNSYRASSIKSAIRRKAGFLGV